jgi:hypothetical protein
MPKRAGFILTSMRYRINALMQGSPADSDDRQFLLPVFPILELFQSVAVSV